MSQPGTKYAVWVGLVVVFVMSVALPARAEYTKLYKFWNKTPDPQSSVRAITNGLEGVTAFYVAPGTWTEGTSYMLFDGTFSTSITYTGPARLVGEKLNIGWTTADNSCRLRDLRWGGGQSINPVQREGVPGGGWVEYDPVTGEPIAYWITNDTDQPITLTNTDLELFGVALSAAELDAVLDEGLVGLRVAAIDALIRALWVDIDEAGTAGDIPGPSARSLKRKLDNAAQKMGEGLAKYVAGDEAKALFLWGKAAHHMKNFISEITNMSEKGNVPDGLANLWIDMAQEIMLALQGLPGTDTSVEGIVLLPGESYRIPLDNVSPDGGFVLCGSVLDGAGNPVLEWAEQATLEPSASDTTRPIITGASITPESLWPPDHEWQEMTLDVTVTDDTYAIWYVQEVISNQPEDGTGDGDYAPDWMRPDDNLQLLGLRRERSGNHPTETRVYSVILQAIDMAGNLAWEGTPPESCILPVRVTHDEGNVGPAQITSLAAMPTTGRGVQIVFTLAASSQVEAEVFNIAGRPIKTIVRDRQYPQGTTSLVWNCSSDRGLPVPSGTYLIRLTARTADGQQGSRLCPVTVQR